MAGFRRGVEGYFMPSYAYVAAERHANVLYPNNTIRKIAGIVAIVIGFAAIVSTISFTSGIVNSPNFLLDGKIIAVVLSMGAIFGCLFIINYGIGLFLYNPSHLANEEIEMEAI